MSPTVVSASKDVTGGAQLVAYAAALAIHPAFRGILHWGQQNDCTLDDVELRFGDFSPHATGHLGRWRSALAAITNDGQLDGFSSEFTRRTGLEVH